MTDSAVLPRHVADTHAIIWHLDNDPRLSATAQDILLSADRGLQLVYASAISLVEMTYLANRGRLDASLVERAIRLLETPKGSFAPVAVDSAIVRSLSLVPRDAVPDMPDRNIVATALHLGLPLISRDRRIMDAGVVPVVW